MSLKSKVSLSGMCILQLIKGFHLFIFSTIGGKYSPQLLVAGGGGVGGGGWGGDTKNVSHRGKSLLDVQPFQVPTLTEMIPLSKYGIPVTLLVSGTAVTSAPLITTL